MTAPRARYVAVFHLRYDDDRRRYFVVDLDPSPEARTGTVIAEVHGEGHATQIAAALNRQPPPIDDPSLGDLMARYREAVARDPRPTVIPGPDAF